MACWTVFEERQALSTTFRSDAASSLSSFMAMDSSGVVTSQVARRGRVVVSPPILFLCVASTASAFCFLAGWLQPAVLLPLAAKIFASPRSTASGNSETEQKQRGPVSRVLERARQSWMRGLVIDSRTFSRDCATPPMDTDRGRGSLPEGVGSCAENIARAGEQKVKGGSLQSTSGGAAGSVVEAPTRHNEKPHHPNTIARPHQH